MAVTYLRGHSRGVVGWRCSTSRRRSREVEHPKGVMCDHRVQGYHFAKYRLILEHREEPGLKRRMRSTLMSDGSSFYKLVTM